ncbi:MFS transporter [Brucella intermedia]|uniref:MFS transporter n=1 Tax=Brucella intermedia TaxID=94625 RepID=UPI00224AA458|nr:MFS transporter [Brucella intermedia]
MEQTVSRKIWWRMVPLLFICYIVSYLDRVNVGFAKLQMVDDLKISTAAYALGASIFFWGYVLFEVPSNAMLNKVGARIWIARIMVSWGIASVALMFIEPIARFFGVSNEASFYVLRFLLGVCEAGFFPGVILYVNQWLPSHKQGKIMAGFLLALPVSLVIGGPLSGALMEGTHGAYGLSGWQWMLFIEGIPAVILGIVVFFCLTDRIDQANWLSSEEKLYVKQSLAGEDQHKSHKLSLMIKDYRVWVMAGIVFTYNTGFYGLSFWMPTLIKGTGISSPLVIGLLTAIPFSCASVCMVINAIRSNATGERRWHVAFAAILGGFGLIGSAIFAHQPVLAIVFLSIAASGILSVMPVFWTFPGAVLSGTAAAAGIAMINCLGSLSGITGAMISGTMETLTGDINDGTYVLGASLFITAILALSIPARTFARGKR